MPLVSRFGKSIATHMSIPRSQSARRSITQQCTTNEGDGDGDGDGSNGKGRTSFDIPNIKKGTMRLILRTHKKIGNVSTRIRNAEEQYDKVRVAMDARSLDDVLDEALLQRMEHTPNMEQYQQELSDLQARLQKLNWLEGQFNNPALKSKRQLTMEELTKLGPDGVRVVQYILELDIDDDESVRLRKIETDRTNKRAKAEKAVSMKDQCPPQHGGRLPYRRYYSEQRTEIRVGKQATDNDVLSLSPEHRSGSHWWYHASGCSGSHVVLCTDAASPSEEDVLDAASLAALKSKCIGQSVIKVSMTRARNVSKPPGAKSGLVHLNGDIRTITIRKSDVERRCKRLEETVVVN